MRIISFNANGLRSAATKGFFDWFAAQDADGNASGPLQLMYGIDGRADLVEETLDHLEGYRGSRPVRIGNAAFQQLQLDLSGEISAVEHHLAAARGHDTHQTLERRRLTGAVASK